MSAKYRIIDVNELNPYVRSCGLQGEHQWPNQDRKIYDYELFYCFKGRGYLKIHNSKYVVKPGTLMVIPPDVPTRLWFEEEHPARLYWVHFDLVFQDRNDDHIEYYLTQQSHVLYEKILPEKHLIRPQLMLSNGLEFPVILHMDNKDQVFSHLESIRKSSDQKHSGWQMYCKIAMLQIFQEVFKQILDEESPVLTEKNITQKSKDYIHSHYYKPLRRKEIADYIGLSEDRLGKIFKGETGCSLMTYLNNHRIDRAKLLLLNSELTIGEIANIIGISDPYYFSKLMKKVTGQSPSNWRKSELNKKQSK